MDTTRADERDQDCEALFRINKQSSNIAGGVHVDKDDLVSVSSSGWSMFPSSRSTQQHNNKLRQPTKQAKARKRKRGRRRGGERRGAEEEGDKQVEKDVMGWTVVTRSRKRTVQIFVKVDGMKTVLMDVSPS